MRISTACALGVLSVFLLSIVPQVAGGVEIPLNNKGLRLKKKFTTLKQLRSRYVTFQQFDYSCGAAVVSTLLTYYFGEPATEREVIKTLFKVADVRKVLRRKAFSLLDMKRFALARGYKAVGYKMDFEFLVELNQPVIVPVIIRNYDHFVIFKGLVGDRVLIADPAFGNYTLRVSRFLSVWKKGIGFILKRLKPRGPMTEEDLRRQARFMVRRDLGSLVTRDIARTHPRIPGQVQLIRGPSPPSGQTFLEFFNIEVTPVPVPPVSPPPGTFPVPLPP